MFVFKAFKFRDFPFSSGNIWKPSINVKSINLNFEEEPLRGDLGKIGKVPDKIVFNRFWTINGLTDRFKCSLLKNYPLLSTDSTQEDPV